MKKNQNQMVAYLPAITVFSELNQMADQLSAVGVTTENTTIGGSFAEWSAQLQAGQTAWLYSLEPFHSITELMNYCESMARQGVMIRSVKEYWFNDPMIPGDEVLVHLFRLGKAIHSRFAPIPHPAACRSTDSIGGTLASRTVLKAKKALDLRTERNMSVVAACRLAGCGVNAYYRYLKEQKKAL